MTKFYGEIGYATTQEVSPGVWQEILTTKTYSGDVTKMSKRWESGEHLNDNLAISNIFSIVADPFAYQNFHTMRYVKWMGACWKITNVEVQRPRLILTIGGVYNGETT